MMQGGVDSQLSADSTLSYLAVDALPQTTGFPSSICQLPSNDSRTKKKDQNSGTPEKVKQANGEHLSSPSRSQDFPKSFDGEHITHVQNAHPMSCCQY